MFMHLTNKYWKLYRKYEDRNDKTAHWKYTPTPVHTQRTQKWKAHRKSMGKRAIKTASYCVCVCVCAMFVDKNGVLVKEHGCVQVTIFQTAKHRHHLRQTKKHTASEASKHKKKKKTTTRSAMKRSKSKGRGNNITKTAPMLKPSKRVREFTAMQFRRSKSYKLLHKFLLKTSSVRQVSP